MSHLKNVVVIFVLSLSVLLVKITSVTSAPVDKNNKEYYNLEDYNTVYDQRQNGSENYRVNVNGVVLVWSPPAGLLQAATLLDPSLFDSGADYSDLEDLINQTGGSDPEKPLEFVIYPEKTTTTSTTVKPAEIATAESVKRKFRVPGFIRPFMNRRHEE